jgi:iron complex outermembrane receptor protein
VSLTSSASDWQLGPYLSVLAFGPAELLNDVALSQRNFNQELRLSSAPDAALRWTAGLFVSDGRTDGSFARSFGPMTFEASDYRIDTTQGAAFGEFTVALARGLEFGAGLRAEQVRSRLLRDGRVPVPARIGRVAESSALLPRASLRWKPRAEAALDVSLVSGYKPGGVSAFTGNAALTGFGAERLAGLELGALGRLAGGRVTASLRGHAYRITGYQVERSFATGSEADDYLVVNAPRASSLGLEAGLSCTLAADLRLSATAALNRTTLREFTDPYTHDSYTGRRAPYSPESDAGLTLEYGAARGWFALARVAHKGRVYYTEGEEALFSQASRTLLSARVGHAWERLRVSLHGENLSDRRYWTSIAPGTYHGAPGAPLSWGAEASLSF